MTLEEAKKLKAGDTVFAVMGSPIFTNNGQNADCKTPMRFKVTSVKLWKTRPNDIVINVKRGLKGYGKFYSSDLSYITINESGEE